MPHEEGKPHTCYHAECQQQATARVAWPGGGWVYYCGAHIAEATKFLRTLGPEPVVELRPNG